MTLTSYPFSPSPHIPLFMKKKKKKQHSLVPLIVMISVLLVFAAIFIPIIIAIWREVVFI